MENSKGITDKEYIEKWVSMLKVFNTIIKDNPPVEKVKKSLEDLIQSASITPLLTGAQKDGIVSRCQNYMNGTYGVNKIKSNYIKENDKP